MRLFLLLFPLITLTAVTPGLAAEDAAAPEKSFTDRSWYYVDTIKGELQRENHDVAAGLLGNFYDGLMPMLNDDALLMPDTDADTYRKRVVEPLHKLTSSLAMYRARNAYYLGRSQAIHYLMVRPRDNSKALEALASFNEALDRLEQPLAPELERLEPIRPAEIYHGTLTFLHAFVLDMAIDNHRYFLKQLRAFIGESKGFDAELDARSRSWTKAMELDPYRPRAGLLLQKAQAEAKNSKFAPAEENRVLAWFDAALAEATHERAQAIIGAETASYLANLSTGEAMAKGIAYARRAFKVDYSPEKVRDIYSYLLFNIAKAEQDGATSDIGRQKAQRLVEEGDTFDSRYRPHLRMLKARITAANGELDQAAELAKKAYEAAREAGIPYEELNSYFAPEGNDILELAGQSPIFRPGP